MSIDFSYRRVTQSDLDALLSGSTDVTHYWFGDVDDLKGADKYFARLEADERYLDIGNQWQALHFLLSDEFCFQSDSQTEAPLCNVVMGGKTTEIECTYGVVHFLTPDEVRDVARYLSSLSRDELADKFDPQAFAKARVYPSYDRWEQSYLQYLLPVFDRVREFFQKAAAENQAVLLSSD